MNYRNRHRKKFYSQGNIQCGSVLYTDMEDKLDDDQNKNFTGEHIQSHSSSTNEDTMSEDDKNETLEAEECIKDLSISSDLDSFIYHNLSSKEICSVCFAENLTFRLEHCGHLYCSGCILALIGQGNFPIQCCAENCSKDIILEDIKYVLDHDVGEIDELAEKSLKAYLEKNRDKIFFCPAPDCSMFIYKNKLKEDKWNCPLCENSICTQCNVVYHEGYSCDMYQGSREDPDYSFKVWQKKNQECKHCPNCKSAIEKRDGCNHMTCSVCNSHFCWICLTKFNSGSDVYAHINDVHPNQLFARV